MNQNKGFNLIGYATSPMGLGEDLRMFAAMLELMEIPFSVIDLPTDVKGTMTPSWKMLRTDSFSTSIFFMSAIECRLLAKNHPYLFDKPKQKIGYFLWELPDFPEEYQDVFDLVDQVWVPTNFVKDCFSKSTNKPIRVIPLPVHQYPQGNFDFRKALNIPKESFVCLYMFDMQSTIKRKNPEGCIRAFIDFNKVHNDSFLILKVSRWQSLTNPDFAWLVKHPSIKIISQPLKPSNLSDLYQASNCYLSLHRSEGFGRTLVEALQQGLDIVSTNYSGPSDFLTEKNSHLVDWSNSPVNQGDYPFVSRTSAWALPDEKDAVCKLMNAYVRKLNGRNYQGILDGSKFSVKNLVSKYKTVVDQVLI